VWEEENAIDPELFPNRCWVDSLDEEARHWVVEDETGAWVAAARMTLHTTLDDDSRDVQVWRRAGKHLPLPTVDLGRLVVLAAHRRKGLAQLLITKRIQTARDMGARSVMATASAGSAGVLKKLGFEDIGERVYFEDRPDTCFHALQLNL
jgi:predicted GNAT family N-acyltransferase